MSNNISNRLKFFLSHLSISLLIALLVIGLVFFVWYPSPLAKAVGVTHISLMLIVIDVIIGPMLTLLIYKDGKKTLKIDLAVIILIQIAALSYGIYNIAQGRPVWIVQNGNRFELVRNNEIFGENLQQAKEKYQYPSWLKPQFVATEFASNVQQRNDDMFADVLGGISIAQRPERYVDLNKAKEKIQRRAQKLELLQQYNNKKDVEKILAQYPQAIAFLPLKATAVDMTVLIGKHGEVIKIVDLRPWK